MNDDDQPEVDIRVSRTTQYGVMVSVDDLLHALDLAPPDTTIADVIDTLERLRVTVELSPPMY